jgi:hypothetical protein
MPSWQEMLERHAGLFAEVQPGASIALAPGSPPRANVKQVREPVPMLLWLRGPDRMAVVNGEYRGLKTLTADALLLPEDGALESALAHAEPLSELKRQLRDGRMLVMVMRSRKELRELGWSEFFEALGLPFQGSCR